MEPETESEVGDREGEEAVNVLFLMSESEISV